MKLAQVQKLVDGLGKEKQLISDGTMFEGYFIYGIETPKGMYTYHYPLEQWEYFEEIKESGIPFHDGMESQKSSIC